MVISPAEEQALLRACHLKTVLWKSTGRAEYGCAARELFWAYAQGIGEDPLKIERADRWGCPP